MNFNHSRREFLKRGGALGAAGVGMPLVMNLMPSTAHAGGLNTSDYKALVCVFLAGGNDAYNTVIRTDRGLERFMAARSTVGLDVVNNSSGVYSAKQAVTIPANANFTGISGLTLAFHPALSRMRALFESGGLSVVGNIGPLGNTVTTAASYADKSVKLPPKLFSHNDQTAVWQSGKPEGEGVGWGGEMVRRFASVNTVAGNPDNLFSAVAIESTPVFCVGTDADMPGNLASVAGFSASRAGGAVMPGDSYGGGAAGFYISRDMFLSGLMSDLPDLPGAPTTHWIERDYQASLVAADTGWKLVSEAGAGSTLTPPNNDNPLRAQLYAVAKMIEMHGKGKLSYGRQVYFVQLGSFDTHSGQTRNSDGVSEHGKLLSQLDEALDYFRATLNALDSTLMDKVLTFTASEFGRKLNENGDGTDHGWGGHQFVMGGQIKGGVYGHFPDLSTWDAGAKAYADPQLLADGTMVPRVPVALFAKELGQWLGINWADADNRKVAERLFPDLGATDALLGFTPAPSFV